jgi:hypothetical protein
MATTCKGLGPVNDQVRVDREKLHRLIGEVLAAMAPAWSSREIRYFLADDGFNPISHLKIGVVLDVAPNLN